MSDTSTKKLTTCLVLLCMAGAALAQDLTPCQNVEPGLFFSCPNYAPGGSLCPIGGWPPCQCSWPRYTADGRTQKPEEVCSECGVCSHDVTAGPTASPTSAPTHDPSYFCEPNDGDDFAINAEDAHRYQVCQVIDGNVLSAHGEHINFADTFPRVHTVTGNFRFEGYNEPDRMITFETGPVLQTLGRTVLFNNLEALESITFTNITNIVSVVDIGKLDFNSGNEALTRVSFPELVSIGGGGSAFTGLSFFRNPLLQDVFAPKLAGVGGRLGFEDDFSLERIELPSLAGVGNIKINNNKCLREIDFPTIERTGRVEVTYNPALELVQLNNLKEVTDEFVMRGGEAGVRPPDSPWPYPQTNIQTLLMNSLEIVGGWQTGSAGRLFLDGTGVKYLTLPSFKEMDASFNNGHGNIELKRNPFLEAISFNSDFAVSNNWGDKIACTLTDNELLNAEQLYPTDLIEACTINNFLNKTAF